MKLNEIERLEKDDYTGGKSELQPAIKSKLSRLYSNTGEEATGLVAYWTGK